MTERPSGVVYLVGAGPGDPGLLTRRAHELLQTADVVAYDALISDAVLAEIGPRAERISVGHRGRGPSQPTLAFGQGPSRAEYKIHPDVIARALDGKSVVRLKQGDPLVFGRGGEEAEELRAAGVAFEIVPGVSAALGAAAAAGIPLTHRRVASDVTLATGHDLLAGTPAATDWSAVARGRGTLVLFMAGKKLGENLARLVESGRAASTPAAYIARASTARQRVVTGTLGDLVARTEGVDRDEPALIIVGEVVSLRETLAWIERRPLHGRRILVARARPGASTIAARLRALGAEVIEAPSVSIESHAHSRELRVQLHRWDEHDAVVFASAEAVEHTLACFAADRVDVRDLARRPFITVGEPALTRLRHAALVPDVHVPGACAEALAPRADLVRGKALLVLAGEDRRPSLTAELETLGARVTVAVAYGTRHHWPPAPREAFDAIVLPSSSAARLLYQSEYGRGLGAARAIAIGPLTEEAARACGAERIERANHDDADAVIAKVEELFA